MAKGFDGSSDAGHLNVTPGYSDSDLWGSFWFYPEALPGADATMYCRAGNVAGNASRIRVGLTSTGACRLNVFKTTPLSNITVTTSAGIPALDAWYHCFWYYTSNYKAIFWNGANKGSSTSTVTPGPTPWTSVGARITATTPTFTEYYEGRLSDVIEISGSSAQTAAEVDILAASGYGGRLPADDAYTLEGGQFRYWPLLKSWNSWGQRQNPFSTAGSPSDQDRAPIIGHKRGQQFTSIPVVSIGGNRRTENSIIVAG